MSESKGLDVNLGGQGKGVEGGVDMPELNEQTEIKFGQEFVVEIPDGTVTFVGVVAADAVALRTIGGDLSAKWGNLNVLLPSPRAGETMGSVVYDFVFACFNNGDSPDNEIALQKFDEGKIS